MKIYTKKGDKGQTSLFRGGKVPKHHLRVEVYGTLDELNSWIGYLSAINVDHLLTEEIEKLQNEIFILSSDIATVQSAEKKKQIDRISANEVEWMEKLIDKLEADLPPLKNFILPSGSPFGAGFHVARTICRRAERRLTELIENDSEVNEVALKYVNRLSDLFFVISRWVNLKSGSTETIWKG